MEWTRGPRGRRTISDSLVQVKAYFQKVAEGYAEYLQEQKSKAVPYYTVVLSGCRTVLDLLYVEGLATHFWQAVPPAWARRPARQPAKPRPVAARQCVAGMRG